LGVVVAISMGSSRRRHRRQYAAGGAQLHHVSRSQ
jgi:hypothetical protein